MHALALMGELRRGCEDHLRLRTVQTCIVHKEKATTSCQCNVALTHYNNFKKNIVKVYYTVRLRKKGAVEF